ncbi:LysR family transcriptional regulator [Ursidibacter sp. B-7004-1]
MNKFYALQVFCIASETLNFRETAQRLNVSPQVVSRVVGDLEALLAEPLFKRNTRNVVLTDFGRQFLPKAQQLLADSEKLFQPVKPKQQAMQGVVRITLPPLPQSDLILAKLLSVLEPYPEITLDWQIQLDKLKTVEHQIDVGIRICQEPQPDWIVKKIITLHEKIVASAKLVEKLGKPKNLQDLVQRYPLSVLRENQSGKLWHWQINEEQFIVPHKPKFICNDMFGELQSVLSGNTCSQLINILCQPYINAGQLVELFANTPKLNWHLYLYRPYQMVVTQRVQFVYEQLYEILKEIYGEYDV